MSSLEPDNYHLLITRGYPTDKSVISLRVSSFKENLGSTVKEVVTAKGQFNSPWSRYLNKAPDWALKSARAVLEGTAPNPIGNRCYFISAVYAKQLEIEKKGINVGDNVFYEKCEW